MDKELLQKLQNTGESYGKRQAIFNKFADKLVAQSPATKIPSLAVTKSNDVLKLSFAGKIVELHFAGDSIIVYTVAGMTEFTKAFKEHFVIGLDSLGNAKMPNGMQYGIQSDEDAFEMLFNILLHFSKQ